MSSIKNFFFILVNANLFFGFLNTEYLAETKIKSMINSFCLGSVKEEMLKANKNYDEELAIDTCDCYFEEFLNSSSHQLSINKCKLEAKKKFNL